MWREKKRKVIVWPENTDGYLEDDNPYISQEQTENALLLGPPSVPRDIMDKAIKLEEMKCSIQFICLCDLFMSFYYYYLNFLLGIFLSLISFNGYLSTIYYKKSLLTCYLAYQHVQVVGRAANLIYFFVVILPNQNAVIINSANSNGTISNGTIISETIINEISNPVMLCIILVSLLLMQIYITYYVTKFYKFLPFKMDFDRITYREDS